MNGHGAGRILAVSVMAVINGFGGPNVVEAVVTSVNAVRGVVMGVAAANVVKAAPHRDDSTVVIVSVMRNRL